MSRLRNNRSEVGRGVVIAGVYQRLAEAQYRGADPRIYIDPRDECTTVQTALAVHSPLLSKLDAGESVVVVKWHLES